MRRPSAQLLCGRARAGQRARAAAIDGQAKHCGAGAAGGLGCHAAPRVAWRCETLPQRARRSWRAAAACLGGRRGGRAASKISSQAGPCCPRHAALALAEYPGRTPSEYPYGMCCDGSTPDSAARKRQQAMRKQANKQTTKVSTAAHAGLLLCGRCTRGLRICESVGNRARWQDGSGSYKDHPADANPTYTNPS